MSKRASGASHAESAKKSRGDASASASSSSSAAAAKSSAPLAAVKDEADLAYLPGFGCELQSEALPHALPVGQNTPQVCPYGLYAEQLSGTSFTTPRKDNQKVWLYRIRPTVGHSPFMACDVESGGEALASNLIVNDFSACHITPNQYRWRPFDMEHLVGPAAVAAKRKVDFIQGLATICGTGSPDSKSGMAIHVYMCNASMDRKAFTNSDGDMLIVPQQGVLHIRTEMGMLRVAPGHVAVVQRGIAFSVAVTEVSRGYICEMYNGHFKLPELGPIGANGLAAPRDFLHPTAEFEDFEGDYQYVQKFVGKWFSYKRTHSPFDVVAWHGNYIPYMYDLSKFCPAGAVRFDHMDPSIFTVLTAAGPEPGVAACDFVIFPPRWAVQEHSFRPPYYHRNVMSEFMGNIMGRYEAKPDGFLPGGASLHSVMASHGPDAATFNKASTEDLKPQRLPDDSLSFMFESTYMFKLTDWALKVAQPDADYWKCWEPIQSKFDPNWKPAAAAASSSSSKKGGK